MSARKFLKHITLLAIFLSFLSCKKENPKQLCGLWSIDKMLYNGKRCDQLLLINTITFNCAGNLVKLNAFDNSDNNAIWKLIEENDKNILEIKSKIPDSTLV